MTTARAHIFDALNAQQRRTAMQVDRVHCCDALTLLRALPNGYVNLIATDPPYMGVKDEWWDKQWASTEAYIAWIGELCQEWRRVLKPNGSLYVFASPQMAARVEVEIGRWFNVPNNIRWRKPMFSTKAEMFDKDMSRAFFPASESIIFAEQNTADKEYQNAIIDENSTYWQACENTKRSLFGDYLTTEFERAKITRKEIAALFPSKTGNLTGCVSNWVLGYNCPTKEQYEKMRDYLNSNHNNGSDDYLRREYDYLRREYEDLRRPFNLTNFDHYTDTWTIETVGHYEGKHPAEKPLSLMQHIVKVSSRPGDVVLDCFTGSGATLDAARRLGRHYIGCDLDPHWADYARARLAQAYTPDMFETLGTDRAPDAEQLGLFAGDSS